MPHFIETGNFDFFDEICPKSEEKILFVVNNPVFKNVSPP